MKDALIYLAATVLCVPLAKKAGLGSVLGYLLAGAAIGPWGLGLIAEVETTMHFSEFGVVLMLFVIGLELEPKRLLSMKREVFGGGTLQLALCGLALAGGAFAAGISWKAALVVGLALALSSTAIAVASMNERNFMPTPTGRSSFAILLFQDIAAIPLLAIVPLLAAEARAPGTSGWAGALQVFAAIAGVIIIGRYLTRPMLRLVAASEVREVFTAFTLLLVIGIAQMMSLAGVSMALGAFLAGVLLAGSEYRHALETDIEPFKGLLLGLFFIAVGMAIDFGLLQRQPGLVALLLAGFLLIKVIMLWLAARLLGITRKQRWLFALLLSQGGEFGFVVFGTARMTGLLSAEWEALLTMTVALSMATTPLLLLIRDKVLTRRADEQRDADTIDEQQPIIIAGFGRFGQIVGRLLFANGIRATVLDHDPDQIETLRKFGYKVFYGDATRLDLLEAAGAKQACLIINAIDDREDSLALTDRVLTHFPQARLIARARNVTHYQELKRRGVEVIERETFESALRLGRHALEHLGMDRYRAREMADIFRRHNIATLHNMMALSGDESRLQSAAKAGRQELEEQFAKDRAQFEEAHSSKDWH
ncbi:MAG: glutathione-regulated potassium-efflux system protein KefC [Betaproteobacteria bacterium]|nr:glutathione-regulated potassium-efflux system protein KefC [Betaproteobacteria bacterium]